MSQQTTATSLAPEIVVEKILGILQVKGWEQPEVAVRANPDDLDLEARDDLVQVSCRGNCSIRLPYGATVKVEKVQGEARFKLLEDQLTIGQIVGGLTLRNVAETEVDTVNGDLVAKRVSGNLRAGQVKGNAMVREVQGEFTCDEISGNLDLRDVEGGIEVKAGGNARIRLNLMGGDSYDISAGGNVHCRVPQEASLALSLSSGAQSIQVKLPDQSKVFRESECELTLGGGDAKMAIQAGGTIYLSSLESAWTGLEDQDIDFGEEVTGISEEFSQQIAQQIESQIEAQMEAITRQLNEQMERLSASIGKAGLSAEQTEEILQQARQSGERAAARAQEKMRRAQEKLERKLEAARRRSEIKAQAAERRSQARGKRAWNWNFEWSPTPPQPPKEPVSDEERLMILRMLEEKKISLEEAEELLAALEGNE